MQTSATWLIANWKMHGDTQRVQQFAHEFNQALSASRAGLHGVFCPPFPYLPTAKQFLPQNARLALGAQNCHAEAKGAFTGEVSAAMLKDSGCSYVIVGHSERRAMGETCEQTHSKANAVIEAGLKPIICIGESADCYESGKTAETLSNQLKYLAKLPAGSYLIAYEPVWAIGSGKTPKTAEIQTAHSQIKSVLGSETSVLYGGSVNPGNVGEILSLREVSGALIGGASLEIESMRALIAAAA